jgi:hypothetical protein
MRRRELRATIELPHRFPQAPVGSFSHRSNPQVKQVSNEEHTPFDNPNDQISAKVVFEFIPPDKNISFESMAAPKYDRPAQGTMLAGCTHSPMLN